MRHSNVAYFKFLFQVGSVGLLLMGIMHSHSLYVSVGVPCQRASSARGMPYLRKSATFDVIFICMCKDTVLCATVEKPLWLKTLCLKLRKH